jgi:hypothetical protein
MTLVMQGGYKSQKIKIKACILLAVSYFGVLYTTSYATSVLNCIIT